MRTADSRQDKVGRMTTVPAHLCVIFLKRSVVKWYKVYPVNQAELFIDIFYLLKKH